MNFFVDLETKLSSWKNRLTTALGQQDPSQQATIINILTQAHQQAQAAIHSGQTPATNIPWELSHGLSLLGQAGDNPLPRDPKLFSTKVMEDGTLLGCRKWELLDPLWGEALVQWIEHLNSLAAFGTTPANIKMDNTVTLAICGDWGTGGSIADAVAAQMRKANADYTIHLGDVYYAGIGSDEQNDFTNWPQGKSGQFTLNSNHEMYNGADGYFNELKLRFPLQNNTSYFSLYNDYWCVIGLDSAYTSGPFDLYMKGNLGQQQLNWLKTLPKDNKKIIVLSHHEAYNIDGSQSTPLYDEVVKALGQIPDYWYWGHLHNGISYTPRGVFHGRCIGHGAIPYGNASILQGKPNVSWYETQSANDPNYPERVLNGYIHVVLNEQNIAEQLIGEDGSIRMSF